MPTPTNTTLKKTRRRWAKKFLDYLSKSGNVTYSAGKCGIERSTAYDEKDANPAFAEAWEEALEQSIELLEYEARRRAEQGNSKKVFYKGKQIDVLKEYSDTLLIFLLKAHKPERYREEITLKVKSEVDKELDAIYDTLERVLPSEYYELALRALSEESGETEVEEAFGPN